MKKISTELVLTLMVILVIFGYFQGVVVPSVEQKYQSAAALSSSVSRAPVFPCVVTTLNKCGRVLITKDTVPNAYQDFSFSTNIPGYSTFLLDDDSTLPGPSPLSQTKVLFTPVNGSFNVWESTLMAGYATTVSCVDPTNNTTTAGMTANIAVDGGETISCTFTNTKTNTNPTIPPIACTPNTWTQKADFGGGARNRAVGFSIGSKGYAGLGLDNSSYLQDFWEFDPIANTWTQKADFGGGARASAVGFSINGKGYVGTGEMSMLAPTPFKDFWEFDPVSNTWLQKADLPSFERTFAVGFSIGNKGYVGTGSHVYFSSPLVGLLQDFWEFDPITNTWIQKADFGGGERALAVGFFVGNKGYIGTGHNGGGYFNDFWEYDPITNLWTQKTNFGGPERNRSFAFSIFNKGYLGAGIYGLPGYQDFQMYDPAMNTWNPKANFGGSDSWDSASFSLGGKGYVTTGVAGPLGILKQDTWEYCP